MKIKLLVPALMGFFSWSLSGVAVANWNVGACPQPHAGPSPCIETEVNGNTYHFNGSGGHAGIWHGHPLGGGFEFVGDNFELDCAPYNANCSLSLSAQVKKCRDSSGTWRIGVRVTSVVISPGDFLCSSLAVGNFPWYSKEPIITSHCPFVDNCDSFIPYNPTASTYTANFGAVDIGALGMGLVDNEHLHGVAFAMGVGATLDFSGKTFYDCNGNAGCLMDGVLTIDNANSLDIY